MTKKKSSESRVTAGFGAAWIVSVAVAFIAGCLFAFIIGNDGSSFLGFAMLRNADTWRFMFFVGGVAAFAAAVVALLTIIFIALPLYCASLKLRHVTRSLYVWSGFWIAVAVSGTIFTLQNLVYDFPGTGLWFPFVAIIIAGPLATMTFWAIVHPKEKGQVH